ncbi:MAG: hypothetical protein LBU11_11220 [Zoogloeaceae bacterium]|nr:hypothetical protein [Zoogloeaceae bacterium]
MPETPAEPGEDKPQPEEPEVPEVPGDGDEPPEDEPPTNEPPEDKPPTDAPPTDAPPTDEPPVDAPPEDGSPADSGGEGGAAGEDAQKGSDNSDEVDPLVLDLDGDGVRFVGWDAGQAYFDLDGDGFATRNAWVSGEDAFLALDKNGDGVINDVGELFGNAEKTGYAALAELDENGDGVLDAADACFSGLRLWRDRNGDGVSQAEEIGTLEEVGIASIGVGYQDVAPQSGNEGQVARQGSFTWEDGRQGMTADVLLSFNPTHTRYVGEVRIDPEVLAVGNVKGYGRIPDLHIAMSLDASFGGYVLALAENLEADTFLADFETMLIKWAGVEGIVIEQIDPGHQLNVNAATGKVVFPLTGESFTLEQLGVIQRYAGLDTLKLKDGHWWETAQTTASTGEYYRLAYDGLSRNLLVKFAVASGFLADVAPGLSYNPDTDQLGVRASIDARMFASLLEAIADNASDSGAVTKYCLVIAALMEIKPGALDILSDALIQFTYTVSTHELEPLFAVFEHVVLQKYDLGLVFGKTGGDTLRGGADNDVLLGLGGDDLLRGLDGDDILNGGTGSDRLEGNAGSDVYVLSRGDGRDVINNDDYYTYSASVDTLKFTDVASDELTGIHRQGNNLVLAYGETDSVTVLNHFSAVYCQLDRYEFSDGKSLTFAELQKLYPIQVTGSYTFGAEDDNLLGLDTDDTISAGNGDDTIRGGAGNDALYGGNGNDVLEGGAGSDRLEGGAGDDVYHFSLGDGADAVFDASGSDVAQFGEGVTAKRLWFSRQGNHLEVSVLGTEGDTLTFEHWYASASHQVEEFRLSDGALLKNAQVQALVDAMREATPPDFGAADAGEEFSLGYPEDLLELIGIQWETPDGTGAL